MLKNNYSKYSRPFYKNNKSVTSQEKRYGNYKDFIGNFNESMSTYKDSYDDNIRVSTNNLNFSERIDNSSHCDDTDNKFGMEKSFAKGSYREVNSNINKNIKLNVMEFINEIKEEHDDNIRIINNPMPNLKEIKNKKIVNYDYDYDKEQMKQESSAIYKEVDPKLSYYVDNKNHFDDCISSNQGRATKGYDIYNDEEKDIDCKEESIIEEGKYKYYIKCKDNFYSDNKYICDSSKNSFDDTMRTKYYICNYIK